MVGYEGNLADPLLAKTEKDAGHPAFSLLSDRST